MTGPVWVMSSKKRIIDQLRDHMGGTWSYDVQMHRWIRDDGYYVSAYSQMDGWSDDSFRTVYYDSEGRPVIGLTSLKKRKP